MFDCHMVPSGNRPMACWNIWPISFDYFPSGRHLHQSIFGISNLLPCLITTSGWWFEPL